MMKLLFTTTCAAMLCVSTAHAQEADPVSTERVTINLGYQPLTPTWGITIITGAKLWKKYLPNVEINRSDFMSGAPLANNMVAGKLDMGYIGDMPAIVLASKRTLTPTLFVSVTDADEGGASAVYVKKDSPIATVKELDGKRVSVPLGGYTHRFAEVLSVTEKIKLNLVGQSPEVGLSSLQAGTVDAYMPWPPYGPLSVYRGFGEKSGGRFELQVQLLTRGRRKQGLCREVPEHCHRVAACRARRSQNHAGPPELCCAAHL